jgi:type I restriction enzyme R subunit
MRVAFLIDEVHRSNTGESNKEMVNVFEKLQDGINQTVAKGELLKKKNLIIGFTATPNEKVLARFGEFKSASVIPTWVPFDAYTMKEAIADGYILDPTKHIIPVVSKVKFEVPEDYDPKREDQDISIEKAKIYSNPERMEQISRFIVNRLVSLVYGQMRGTGKAMLAVTSIPNAIAYCNYIRKFMAEKCKEPLYQRYKDAPVCIVYSDNQSYESSSSMNNQMSEEKVIEFFKQEKMV